MFVFIILSLLLATIWPVLFFPAFSLSTGELKCRGMYVDEHAFSAQVLPLAAREVPDLDYVNTPPLNTLIDSTTPTPVDIAIEISFDIESMCSQLLNLGASYCKLLKQTNLMEIVVDAVDKPPSIDAIVVPIVYALNHDNVNIQNKEEKLPSQDVAFQLAMRLTQVLAKAMWLSRRAVILLVPVSEYNCTQYTSCEISFDG